MERALAPARAAAPPAERRPAEGLAIEPAAGLAKMSLRDVFQLAEVLVPSGFLPKRIQSIPEAVAIMLTGQEIGVGAMAALRHITVVEGRPNLSAELMLGLINHTYGRGVARVKETTNEQCTVEWRNPGWDDTGTYTFTIQDAQRAGLANKPNWKSYPAAMLRARAVSAMARMAFPEVAMGMATEVDEASEMPAAVTVVAPAPPALSAAPTPVVRETERARPPSLEGTCSMCGAGGAVFAAGTLYDAEYGTVCVDRIACQRRDQAARRRPTPARPATPEIFLDGEIVPPVPPPARIAHCAICGHEGPCVDDGEADICTDQTACVARTQAREADLFSAVTEEQPSEAAPAAPKPDAAGQATLRQVQSIQAHLERTGLAAAPFLEQYRAEAFEDLSQDEASALIRDLGKRPNAPAPATPAEVAF